VEDYKVDLHHVLAMELIIDPNLGKNQAISALADWRIAGDVPTGEPLRYSVGVTGK
jgi:hypothetical protein